MTTKSGKRLAALVGERVDFTNALGKVVRGKLRSKHDRYFLSAGEVKIYLHANYCHGATRERAHDRTRVYDRRLFETKEQLELYKQRQGFE